MSEMQTSAEHEMMESPTPQHKWLDRLLGEWEGEGEACMAPGSEGHGFKTTETVRTLGGLWVIAEAKSQMDPDMSSVAITTIGYDKRTGRYVGSWVGSMMSHMWVYDGEVDESGNKLTLYAEGPNMSGDGTAKYKDVIEFQSDTSRTLTSYGLDENGKWNQFMQMKCTKR